MKSVGLAVCILAIVALGESVALGQAGKSLTKCQATVSKESSKYIRTVADTLSKCLNKISSQVIADGAATSVAASNAATACVGTLRRIVNTEDATKQLADKFNAKVGKACDPAINPGLLHMESDTYTVGSATLSAANLNTYCQNFGGDGTIGDFDEWRNCVRAAAECEARQAIALQWPRALEYFAALKTAIMALPVNADSTDALTALVALDSAMEGTTDDDVPELGCGPASGPHGKLLVTGVTQCDQGAGTSGSCPGSPGGQDGAVGAGEAFSYTDNGDGTITDNVTGLIWEKLDDNNSDPLHDEHTLFGWYNAFKKIQVLNGDNAGCIALASPASCCSGAGTGTCTAFVGFTDWRLPNVRELHSLVDYGTLSSPTVQADFNSSCTPGCSATGTPCSCTRSSQHWTSSTYFGGTFAWSVSFLDSSVNSIPKSVSSSSVRAVRGGL